MKQEAPKHVQTNQPTKSHRFRQIIKFGMKILNNNNNNKVLPLRGRSLSKWS